MKFMAGAMIRIECGRCNLIFGILRNIHQEKVYCPYCGKLDVLEL